ncbi:acyl-CoA dehydrogenase family protein [Mycobacterium sp. 663a-19]|uniref:acyl-CoA dehydrogenase family protein n=1 Tax=Mycobacterium sp. 663a-19 TaxID=2986148 RepID=UPI002D1E8D08|nr:acyl-CoA dehydrogenase family protein [Mycobacterium sp. 663a-19]MEB3980794.1 acyl-CoA dehydrogenase family protein [Mycobacterium sp. 663a-19]
MPAFALTAEQRDLVRDVGQVAAELRPLATAGPCGRVNRDLLRALGERGLLARMFAADGTAKAAAMDLCLLRESLAAVSTEAETALALQGLGSYPFLLWGNPAARNRWRAAVVDGSAVAAFALSEPGAGSDAAALSLQARPDGRGWRLHGEKMWISNAPDADVYTVFARTKPGTGARGITAFVIAGDSPGLGGEHLEMLSPHPIGRLTFDGVPVGPEEVVGEVDAGFRVAMQTLDLFRPSVGAFALGMAQAALDVAIEHTMTREAFGGVLCDQQAVAHKLADMATRLEAGRLLVYKAASAYDAGCDRSEITYRSAMAKLEATEAAQFVVDTAVQLVGARALQRGHPLEHLYRDVRAPRIYEGASEIQRTIISRHLTQLGQETR